MKTGKPRKRNGAEPLYKTIADKLRKAIQNGQYPPDSFLPTQEEMTGQLQASLSTVRHAVELLSDEGLVSREQGRGVRVLPREERRPRAESLIRRFGFIAIAENPHIDSYSTLMNAVNEYFISRGDSLVYKEFVTNNYTPQDAAHFAAACEGIVLTGEVDTEIIAAIQQKKIPLVLAGHAVPGSDLHAVSRIDWDTDSAGHMAVQMLYALGHKSIGFCLEKFATTYQETLWKSIRYACETLEIEASSHVLGSSFRNAEQFAGSVAIAGSPTALIVVGEPLTRLLVEMLEEKNCRVPRDCSVLCLGRPNPQREGINLSHLIFDTQKMGCECAALLENSKDGQICHRSLAPTFNPGASIALAPASVLREI